MVKNSLSRAYGTNLRQVIVKSAGNRFTAFASGAAVTALLQSSTATILILVSFIKNGFISAPLAFAAILGADVSTTIVAQILSMDLSWLSPVMMAVGVIAYMNFERSGRERHVARAIIGIGLLLLALTLIRQTIAPLKDSEEFAMILAPLQNEAGLAIAVAALMTWMLHSSLAAVLIFAAFAAHGLISMDLGFHFVLGANLGGALVPLMATYREGLKVRRITIGNVVMRFLALVVCLPFLGFFENILSGDGSDVGRMLVDFHTIFNIMMAIIFLPFVGLLSRAVEKFLPDIETSKDESAPQYLDESALRTPVIALAGAARETLRMSEIVEKMLDLTFRALQKNDDRLVKTIQSMDNTVDGLNQAIKLYLTRLSQESFDPKESDRYIQILTFSTNLEFCGDIIDKSLLPLAMKKMRSQEKFTDIGFAEISEIHKSVLENIRLAQTIFLSEDPELAAQLVANKKNLRQAESETSKRHFRRLQERKAESVATSSMHLDIVRDLRRINSYITNVAYAIVENAEKHGKKRKKRKPKPPVI
jgi:phosphate:Na+ symporter